MVLGTLIACIFGEIIGLSVTDPFNPNSQMLTYLPTLLVLPLVIVGLAGNAGQWRHGCV